MRKVLIEQKLKTGLNEYVFLNPEGKPYQRCDSLKRCFEGACRRAGIKGLRFHDLRHTAATRMVEKGANIAAVSRMLGHSSWNTTMRYAHPVDSLREAAEKLADFESTTDQSTDQQKKRITVIYHKLLKLLAPPEGFEPPTCGFEVRTGRFS